MRNDIWSRTFSTMNIKYLLMNVIKNLESFKCSLPGSFRLRGTLIDIFRALWGRTRLSCPITFPLFFVRWHLPIFRRHKAPLLSSIRQNGIMPYTLTRSSPAPKISSFLSSWILLHTRSHEQMTLGLDLMLNSWFELASHQSPEDFVFEINCAYT